MAVVVIVATLTWFFDTTRTRSYSGPEFTFTLRAGQVTLHNPGQQPVRASIRSATPFRITGSNLGTIISGSFQRRGQQVTYEFNGQLPPNTTTLRIVRGTDVTFNIRSTESVRAETVPVTIGDLFANLVIGSLIIGVAALIAVRQEKVRARTVGRRVALYMPGRSRRRRTGSYN